MNEPTDTHAHRYPVRLVAARTGLSPHVLRAWERRYSVVTPIRSDGGQRLYSQLDIERLHRLRVLTDRGHAIGRIAALPLDALVRLEQETPPAPPAVRRSEGAGAPMQEHTVREFAAAAMRATRQLNGAELQAVLERAAITLGVPDFLEHVVAGTLEDIGKGWVDRTVSVAQEHLATSVFLRVLGWLLKLYEVSGAAPKLVVATPPGQVHELGALMVAVSAAARGWGVVYLGPDLPVAELVAAAQRVEARVVAISAVYDPNGEHLVAAVRETRAELPPQVPLVIGGAAVPGLRSELEGDGIVLLDSLQGLRALLGRLAETGTA